MDTQANNSLIKVEEFNQIMQSAPATLRKEVLARMNWMRRSQSIWQRRK